MFIIYDLIFLFVALFYVPIYLFSGKFHSGFLKRLGFYDKNIVPQGAIWVHAVSVGEAAASKMLVEELRKRFPEKKFIFSTVTPTGNAIARSFCRGGDFLTYLPLDFSFIVSRVINKFKPSLFLIAETEIWPNLISCLSKQGVPVVIFNARISDKSFSGYKKIRLFIAPLLKKIDLFCVQTKNDAEHLIELGADKNKIRLTGNLKFDIPINTAVDFSSQRSRLGLGSDGLLLVAGSTHPGEEDDLLDVYRLALETAPSLKLLLGLRHPQRASEVANLVSAKGFQPVLASKLPFYCADCLSRPVFILDTVGELMNFYAACDIVFVGGSLVKKGGHNILEPASLAKPIIVGPYMYNFRDVSNLFLANKAAIQVNDKEELLKQIKCLLTDKEARISMGERAKGLVIANRGAASKTADHILQLL